MKRFCTLLLALVIMFSMAACGNSKAGNPPGESAGVTPGQSAAPEQSAAQEQSTVPGSSEEPQTRVVTDAWNREVEIPYNVESIICLGSMGPRFSAYLDVVNMMAGAEDIDINKTTARFDYSPVYHEQLKVLPSVGSGGGSGENNGYAEQIIQIQPDVILAGFNEEAADELQRQTGIPVVSVRYRAQGFIDEGFHKTLRLFAEVVGAQERCEEVLAYIDACKADLNNRTKDIPAREKLKAYTGAVTFNGRHGFAFTYVNFPAFTAVNANNVADIFLQSATGEAAEAAAKSGTAYVGNDGFDVDWEQIIEWDPDIIFLDPGNMDLVNDEYANNPGFFDSLRAVKEGKVYTMPSTNAAGPNVTYLLINAYYAGKVLYPERFGDINLEEKAGEIMNLMLGEAFFDEMEAEGFYYGKISIGE